MANISLRGSHSLKILNIVFNGHHLMLERPIKKPLILTPHFILNISLFKFEQRDKHPISFSMDGFREGSYLAKDYGQGITP